MWRDGDIRRIVLYAADPRELAAWYGKHLGVHPTREAPGAAAEGAHSPPVRITPTDAERPEGGWSITFTVSDLDSVVRSLREAGTDVDYVSPDIVSPDIGGGYARMRDPEGNRIELWQLDATVGQSHSSDETAVRVLPQRAEQQEPVSAAEAGRQRRRTRIWTALGVAVLGLVAALVIGKPGTQPDTPTGQGRSTSTGESPGGEATPEQRPVRVTDVGHDLLGISAGWELFASGAGQVVRVEFARGRITTTQVPGLTGSGSVSLVTGPHRVLVQPHDSASGFLIPDGRAPREPAFGQTRPGPLFPGPQPGQVWVPVGSQLDPALSLRSTDGASSDVAVEYPAGEFQPSIADGNGKVLFDGVGGVYLASPGGLRKVADGTLLAVGPTRLLVLQCDNRARCSRVVLNRNTGERHTVRVKCVHCDYPVGAISPDGSLAAVVRPAATYRSELRLIDLDTGQVRQITQMRGPYHAGAVAWSPNGRWLFAASRGSLFAFDTRTEQAHDVDFSLPPISQVTVRPAASPATG